MSFKHDERIIIYPNYLNSKKTVAEGRRIPKSLACENPTVVEMLDCCKYLKVPAEIEEKYYSRDWLVPGRLRVQLKQDDAEKTPCNPEITMRRMLLVKIAELVPKHPGRSAKRQQAVTAKAEASTSAGASSSQSTSNKKKGKKK